MTRLAGLVLLGVLLFCGSAAAGPEDEELVILIRELFFPSEIVRPKLPGLDSDVPGLRFPERRPEPVPQVDSPYVGRKSVHLPEGERLPLVTIEPGQSCDYECTQRLWDKYISEGARDGGNTIDNSYALEANHYTVTDDFSTLAEQRKREPNKLHLLARSADRRGVASLNRTFARVKVATHALPMNRAEAAAIHGAAGVNVPIQELRKFAENLTANGAALAPKIVSSEGRFRSAGDQLLASLKGEAPDTLVLIPGHIDHASLKLRDGSSVSLDAITAANPNLTVALIGCNSGSAKVSRAAIIATGAKLTYPAAMATANVIRSVAPSMKFQTLLLQLQRIGPYVGLVGVVFIVSFDELNQSSLQKLENVQ